MIKNNRDRTEPPCFSHNQWGLYLKLILSAKTDQARQAGKNVVNSHASASHEELQLLSLCCVWSGNTEMADFFALNKLLFHLVARCCEASALKKSYLSVKEIHEDNITYKCLSIPVERNKTYTTQELMVYTHKTNYHSCAYFALAYKLVIDNGHFDELFPKFFNSLKREGNIKIESNASSVFSRYYAELIKLASHYDDEFELPPGMTSHSVGKSCVINYIHLERKMFSTIYFFFFCT